jgi:hypothetical protein
MLLQRVTVFSLMQGEATTGPYANGNRLSVRARVGSFTTKGLACDSISVVEGPGAKAGGFVDKKWSDLAEYRDMYSAGESAL